MEISKQGLDLERELTCSICTEVLFQPLTLLDCLHTFCGACLKEWFAFQLTSSRNNPHPPPSSSVATPFTCPSCRAAVRATRKNATVTTLLEMFLTQHPERGRTEEERREQEKKYTVGEEVLPKIEERERTVRERRMEDEDQRLVNQVQAASLREVGVESPEERRERRRRREERARASTGRSGRESSRDASRDRVTVIRGERRRDGAESSGGEGQRRSRRDRQTASTSSIPMLHPDPAREERHRRRRERSAEESAAAERRREDELRRRNVEAADRSAAQQIEHQPSLRSLISSSDVDTTEVEEEILRQIRDEGLLDGIDLENIDAAEEVRISERIAEAFRRRQEERAPTSAASMVRTRERSASNREERRPVLSTRSAAPQSGTTQYPPRTEHRRHHSRSLSTRSAADEPGRTSRTHLLEPHSSDEARISSGPRRRRDTSQHSRRSATSPSPSSSPAVRALGQAQRSQTDIADRERRMVADMAPSRPSEARTTSDPQTNQMGPSMADVVEQVTSRRRGPPPALPPRELPAREREQSRVVAELDVASSPTELEAPRREREHIRGTSQSSAPASVAVTVPTPPIPANVPLPVELDAQPGLIPAPSTPTRPSQHSHTPSTALERALTLSASSRPNSSSSATSTRNALPRYPEPSITCNRCSRPHIEYQLHYSCSICANGTYNICLPCYRAGKGCLHWFGFGYAAFAKYEKLRAAGQIDVERGPPHMLYAERYEEPKRIPGGAEGRRTLTTEDPEGRLQTGAFCAGCQQWANECYWRCDYCNEGDWGFCNGCVNKGKCCTHPLLPLLYVPEGGKQTKKLQPGPAAGQQAQDEPPHSPAYAHPPPQSASLLEGPNAVALGSFKPLSFRVLCDICRSAIGPRAERFHCYACSSSLPGRETGDYDVCTPCYHALVSSRRISAENGWQGWRRCLKGHRMVVLRFEEGKGGQRRVVDRDLVGGWTLSEEPLQGGAAVTVSSIMRGVELQRWAWANGTMCRLVTRDVSATAPTVSAVPGMVVQGLTSGFPKEGGEGMRTVALWSWWPREESADELAFPKGAVVGECVDVNGDWFFGSYLGGKGLFPAPYVRVVE